MNGIDLDVEEDFFEVPKLLPSRLSHKDGTIIANGKEYHVSHYFGAEWKHQIVRPPALVTISIC